MGGGYDLEDTTNNELRGVIPRVILDLFEGFKERTDMKFVTKVSYIEVRLPQLTHLMFYEEFSLNISFLNYVMEFLYWSAVKIILHPLLWSVVQVACLDFNLGSLSLLPFRTRFSPWIFTIEIIENFIFTLAHLSVNNVVVLTLKLVPISQAGV